MKSFYNENLEIFWKNLILQLKKYISRSALQIGFLFLDRVGKRMNNLNLKSQVIWFGESKDIYKFLKHVSHIQTIQNPQKYVPKF